MKKIAAACAMLMTGCVYAAIPEGYVEKKGTDPDIRTYVNSQTGGVFTMATKKYRK